MWSCIGETPYNQELLPTMESVKLFAFKRALFNISNRLTDYDVGKMKFMLSDYLPRQQLEKSRSGFDLLCLMASRSDLLSCEEYSLLEELLREAGKGDLVRRTFSASYSSPTVFSTSPVVSTNAGDKRRVKTFLSDLSDNLTLENVHDLCQFFAGVCESINYQNLHHIKTGSELFLRLMESGLIGVNQLEPLHQVLSIIGRLDLASSIETFNHTDGTASTASGTASTASSCYGSTMGEWKIQPPLLNVPDIARLDHLLMTFDLYQLHLRFG